MEYVKGKGILVGTYSESDVLSGKDKEDVSKKKKETGYNFVNTEFVKKNGKITGIRIYVCTATDFKI